MRKAQIHKPFGVSLHLQTGGNSSGESARLVVGKPSFDFLIESD